MRIAVIGVGTSGLMSLSQLLYSFDKDVEIVSIHSEKISILGVGESTTPLFCTELGKGTGFNFLEHGSMLNATIKHGVRFVNWRDHDFFHNFLNGNYGIHFDNSKLKDCVFELIRNRWKKRFEEIIGEVQSVRNVTDGVEVSVNGSMYYFDYVIDSRGYPDDYTNYYVSKHIPVNHALVYTRNDTGIWNYTFHYAHKNGWMFGIPLEGRQGWGYLYNDKITSKEKSLDDLSSLFKTKVLDSDVREFSFKNFYTKKLLDGRIILNGNRCFFFEPLQAFSQMLYYFVNTLFIDFIKNKCDENFVNQYFSELVDDVEDNICFHYHGGSIHNTKFWKYTKKVTSDKLKKSKRFADIKENLKYHNSRDTIYEATRWGLLDNYSCYLLDREFGYSYFN